MVPLKGLEDQGVRNAPKGILKVEECAVESAFLILGILEDLIKNNVMLNASIDAREKRLLHLRIDELVTKKVLSESFGEDKVVSLTNATRQCKHPKVPGITGDSFLVDYFHYRCNPGGWWGNMCKDMFAICGKCMMKGWQI